MSDTQPSTPPPFQPQQPAGEAPPRASSGLAWKILLGLFGGGLLLLLLCVGAGYYALNSFVSLDPSKVTKLANEIAVMETPDYFHPMMSMSLMGVRMAYYQGDDHRGLLALMDAPNSAQSRNQLVTLMRQQWNQQMMQQGRNARTETDSRTETFEVRGQPVEFQVLESEGDDGTLFREISGDFEGATGVAFLGVLAPDEQVSLDELRQMIESIE